MADALKQKFDTAVEEVRTAGEWSKAIPNDRRLLCYGMFKQANQGDVTGTQPWAVQFEARSKWDAWNNVKGMSKNDAMVSSVLYPVTSLFYFSNISLISWYI
jgi:diazepam-binding inhibitor (GABA receptor modulator, acyl-CoA-binding protein)